MIMSLEDALNGDGYDMMNYLAQTNNADYNMRKLVEESLELGEVMMKYLNKHVDHPKRPSKEDIVGEFSDIIFRGSIALMNILGVDMEDLGQLIGEHIDKKAEKFKGHLRGGKYQYFL